MAKLRVGHKQNSALNKEWAGHVRKWRKRYTSGQRRMRDREIIIKELRELTAM